MEESYPGVLYDTHRQVSHLFLLLSIIIISKYLLKYLLTYLLGNLLE
jgi:hypothetical protein